MMDTTMDNDIDLRSSPKVSLQGIGKEFGSFTALQNVSLGVDSEEFVSLVGASGCGKSTLLDIIAGLQRPTSGSIAIDGDSVIGPGPDRGMVFQAYSLYPWKTAAQNVAFALELNQVPKPDRQTRVDELLEVMGLTAFADRFPKELSGGMRQRVAIARALAPEPDVLLLDEPFGALDAITKRNLQEFLRTVWLQTSTTVVMVTHDVTEAVYLSGRICVMAPRPGRVREVIEVPFGDDRTPATKRDPRFLDLVGQIEHMLDADAKVAP